MNDDERPRNWPDDGPDCRPTHAQVVASDALLAALETAQLQLARRTEMWVNVACTPVQASRYLRYMAGQTLEQIAAADGVTVRAVHKSVSGWSSTPTDRSSQRSPAEKVREITAHDPVCAELLAEIRRIREELDEIEKEYAYH